MSRLGLSALIVVSGLGLAACEPQKKAAGPVKPATLEVIGHETELLKLTLTPDAERRLGLEIVAVGEGALSQAMSVHGEVVAPGSAGLVPGAATDPTTLAANQARADGDVARAEAQLELAQTAAKRSEDLVKAEAGSARARDEANSAVTVAQANLKAAQTQRGLLGPSVSTLNQQGYLWVRATVYAGDLERIDRQASATVQPLGGEGVVLTAKPVNAPPSANAAAGTIDLYFGFSNTGSAVSVGQRVSVGLPVRGATNTGLTIPASALLRDIYGGEWVYVRIAPHAYERRRVEIAAAKDGHFQLNRGLNTGDEVVTAGAAELFGTEFGAK